MQAERPKVGLGVMVKKGAKFFSGKGKHGNRTR